MFTNPVSPVSNGGKKFASTFKKIRTTKKLAKKNVPKPKKTITDVPSPKTLTISRKPVFGSPKMRLEGQGKLTGARSVGMRGIGGKR